MSKIPIGKLYVIFDGSWQERDQKYPSNLALLYDIFIRDPKGKTFYHEGVGSDWNPITGGAFGLGLKRQVTEAFRWVSDNYIPGKTELYIFGGSRGATAARWLTGLLDLVKPGHKVNPWKEYKKLLKSGKTYSTGIKVNFLGVFDTVGSYGVPAGKKWYFAPSFPDNKLGKHVIDALHLVAIHEDRWAFTPSLWDNVKTGIQIAITGNHGDLIGGGGNAVYENRSLNLMLYAFYYSLADGSFELEMQATLEKVSDTFYYQTHYGVSHTPPKRDASAKLGVVPRTLDFCMEVVSIHDVLTAHQHRRFNGSKITVD